MEQPKQSHTPEETQEPDIAELEREIDYLDAQIMKLWERRNQRAHELAATRLAAGEPVHPHSEELADRRRFVDRAQTLGLPRVLGGEVIDLLIKASHVKLPQPIPEDPTDQ